MTSDIGANGLLLLALLILPILALIARRVPVLRVLGQLAIWAAIFAGGIFLLGHRERFDPYVERLTGWLKLDGQSVVGKEVRIRMASDGHFWANVSIGGVKRRMLIDSGATITALSVDTAQAAGVDPTAPALPMVLQTANGAINAREAVVDEMRLGDIVARRLSVVVAPAFGDTDVLGMNFLSRLKSWRVEGSTLILTPHHPQDFT